MKTLLAFFQLGFFLLVAQTGYGQWTSVFQNSVPGVWVENLRPVNDTVLWASISKLEVFYEYDSISYAQIVHTNDGGVTWKIDTIPGTKGFLANGVSALSKDTAWVTLMNVFDSVHCRVYLTTDGGNTWKKKYKSDNIAGMGIHFFNHQDGVLFRGSRVRVTHDGGESWQEPAGLPNVNFDYNLYNYAGDAFDVWKDTMWIPLLDGTLLKSVDRGNNWTVISTPLVGQNTVFCALTFASAKNGLAACIFTKQYDYVYPTRLFRTKDGGITWTEVPAQNLPTDPDDQFFGAIKAVKGTQASFIMTSLDFETKSTYDFISHNGGLNWQPVPGSYSPHYRQMFAFSSPDVVWSGNGFGYLYNEPLIFKWTGGNITSTQNPSEISEEWMQYPNPALDAIHIKSEHKGELPRVVIYNAKGEQMNTSTGNPVTFDVKSLAPGIYYTVITRNGKPVKTFKWVKG